ncbi:MAG: hypothetical protein WB392_05190 [Methanotrichaceae archaeon]
MSPGDRITKGLDFMLKDIAPKGKTSGSRVATQESGVVNQDTRAGSPEESLKTQDTGVTTQESVSIIPEEEGATQESSITTQESSIQIHEFGVTTHDSGDMTPDAAIRTPDTRSRSRTEKRKSRVRTQESSVVPDDIIDQAVAQALQSPKISLYSPLLLAVLESQQLTLLNRKAMTLLHYRKATKARELVEKALIDSYSDLCEKILKRINEGNGKS